MTFQQTLVFAFGCVANLAVVAALLVFFQVTPRAQRTPFSVAGTGLAGVLLIMGFAWAGYLVERSMVIEAMAGLRSAEAIAFYCKGLAECATSVTLGLYFSLFPSTVAAGFFVWGLASLPARGDGKGAASLVVAVLCLTAGIGLILVALGDYLRFDDFFGFLMLLG